jgi:hypothetical protein
MPIPSIRLLLGATPHKTEGWRREQARACFLVKLGLAVDALRNFRDYAEPKIF